MNLRKQILITLKKIIIIIHELGIMVQARNHRTQETEEGFFHFKPLWAPQGDLAMKQGKVYKLVVVTGHRETRHSPS